jgi:hypothetical protein
VYWSNPPSAHRRRTAHSGARASARASGTNTHEVTSQHTPVGRRCPDAPTTSKQTRAATHQTARRGGATTAGSGSTHTGGPTRAGLRTEVRGHRLSEPAISQRRVTTTHQFACAHALEGGMTSAQPTPTDGNTQARRRARLARAPSA